MAQYLVCMACRDRHQATRRNFPLKLYGKQQEKPRGQKVIVGYICKKCYGKKKRQDFIEKLKIKPAKGQSISQAIKQKIEEMRKKNMEKQYLRKGQ